MRREHHPPKEHDNARFERAMRGILFVILTLCGIGGASYLWNRSQHRPPDQPAELAPAKPTKPRVELPQLPFTDITLAAGISFRHENGAIGEKLLPETMGGGCAFFDYDNDGDQDVLFVNSSRWPWDHRENSDPMTMQLYENDGAGRFKNVTQGSGLDVSLYGMGAACGDYDNDGLVDVFLSALGPNRLFRNLGQGKFEDVTRSAGVAGEENQWSTSSGWFDYDNDGDLDLLVANYIVWSREFNVAQDFTLKSGGRAYGQPQSFPGTNPYLYRNEGGGKFTEVAKDAGLHLQDPRTGEPLGKSLGVAFCDFDQDGGMDFVIANDTVRNFLFHNQGHGKFLEIGVPAGIAFDDNGQERGAMGIDIGKFRSDGPWGIAIGNFASEMTALYMAKAGELTFTDVAVSSGLKGTRQDLTFGVFFFDPDLDGRLDLFAANGHLEEDIQKVQSSQRYEQPPQLLWNCGSARTIEFCPLTKNASGEDLLRPMVGRGAAYADIEGDGDQDILITACGRAPRLLRNDQELGHHWIKFQLEGTKSNRDAIGSWITLTLPKGITLSQQVMPTRSYLSQVELPVTFGLGHAVEILKAEILWPDGSKQALGTLEADRMHRIVQPQE